MTHLTDCVEEARRATTPVALPEAAADFLGQRLGGGPDEGVLRAEPTLTLLRGEIPPHTEDPPHAYPTPRASPSSTGARPTPSTAWPAAPARAPGETRAPAGAVLPTSHDAIHSVANHGPTLAAGIR